MSNRALLFTTGSPFSRIVRIVLDELGLDYERREEITTPTSERRAEATPTLQVPTFWDGEVAVVGMAGGQTCIASIWSFTCEV